MYYVYTSHNDYYRSKDKSVELMGVFENENDAWDCQCDEIENNWDNDDEFSETWIQDTPYTEGPCPWDAVDRLTLNI